MSEHAPPLADAYLARMAEALSQHYDSWQDWRYGANLPTGDLLSLVLEVQGWRAKDAAQLARLAAEYAGDTPR